MRSVVIKVSKRRKRFANLDPISGTPGSHPLGTGIGTTLGGIAGTLIGASLGPAGAGSVLVICSIVGGWIGKVLAEKITPTSFDIYYLLEE